MGNSDRSYNFGHLKTKFLGIKESSERQKAPAKTSRNRHVKKAKSITIEDSKIFQVVNLQKSDWFQKDSNMGSKNIKNEKSYSSNLEYFLMSKHQQTQKDKRSNSATLKSQQPPGQNMRVDLDGNVADEDYLERFKAGNTTDGESQLKQKIERNLLKKQTLSSFVPHGVGVEKFYNEERFNTMTDRNLLKTDPTSVFKKREKSVDLSLKSSKASNKYRNLITEKLINSNKLAKYLTEFIGNKDFRTTEQRELDKWTFTPKFYSTHRRYKTIKGRLSNYLKGDEEYGRAGQSTVHMIENQSSLQNCKSADSRYSSILATRQHLPQVNENIYKQTNFQDNWKSIILIEELKANPSLFKSETPTNLEIDLKFGYSHKFKEKAEFKKVSKSKKQRAIKTRELHAKSPGHTVKLSLNDFNVSNGSFNKTFSRSIEFDKKRNYSINSEIKL